jgi:alkaline phosphatase D
MQILAAALAFAQSALLSHGPMTGDVTAHSARIWARAAQAGSYALRVSEPDARGVTTLLGEATPDGDLCLHWSLEGLTPAHEYRCEVVSTEPGAQPTAAWTLRTPPEGASSATLAFGSCSSDKLLPKQPIWSVITACKPDALVLLGDNPYIDSTDLAVQRARYREFYALPDVRGAVAAMSIYATWDDHDFGTNDCDGRVAGKENSRRAFLENHANPSYGENDRGVYTSFRHGPVEVFLLDTRWFSHTEDSPFAPGKPTLLGAEQWKWLEAKLAASTAPFKVVACGMIWNDAVRPGKTDYWGAYPWERDAFFRMLGEKHVTGVVLVGGDIHRSRVVRHATREIVGYEITELITSPMAQNVIAQADVLAPGLVWDAGIGQSAMVVKATNDVLEATFLQASAPGDPAAVYTTRIASEHLKAASDARDMHPKASGFLFESIHVGDRDYKYAVYVPRNVERNGPGLLFLHGSGESGTDGSLQLAQGLGTAIAREPDEWPFVVVFPQKPSSQDEWEDHEAAVLAMLERAITEYSLDRARIGITGLSQGGHGTWEIARRHPELFAAIAPICGYPAGPARGWANFDAKTDWTDDRAQTAAKSIAEALAKKPMWIFHGDADASVPFRFSEFVDAALRARGGAPRFTKYPGVGHNAWDKAYREEKLALWFLAQMPARSPAQPVKR